MNNTYRNVRLALVLLLGGSLAVGLMFVSVACQTTPGRGDKGYMHRRPAPAYRQVAFNRELHGCVTGATEGLDECMACHHEQPNAANQACIACHSRTEGHFSAKLDAFVPRLKDAMHNPDSGCRSCHDETTDDGLWQCSMCHKGLTKP